MKKIDIYIIKKFLGTYFFSIVLIIGIAVMFDITEKMDRFANNNAPLYEIAVHYYLNFVPYFANMFSSLFAFISVVFFTSKMAYNTEIIAILASGVSFNRIIRPYVISAIIIGLLSFFLGSYVIPPANKVRLQFEQVFIKKKSIAPPTNVHIELKPDVYVYINSLDAKTNKTGSKFTMETFKNDDIQSKLSAETIVYDTLDIWVAHSYLLREFEPTGEKITRGDTLTLHLAMNPEEFIHYEDEYQTMDNSEIKAYIDKQNRRGVGNVTSYIVELNQRYSGPFTAVILSFIGLFIASRKVRGGIGLHIMLGFIISFSYILFNTISVSFSTAGSMDPILSVWLPNIVFSGIALVLYFKAQK